MTGGEPALRIDLEDLVGGIDNRSFSILFTTGHSIDGARAKRLKEAGLTAIVVSLDSHIKGEHNEKRNSETAFDDAISAIKDSLQAGIYTAISTVITKEIGVDKFPIRDKEKIEYLLSRLDKRPIPKLFSKLGFKKG